MVIQVNYLRICDACFQEIIDEQFVALGDTSVVAFRPPLPVSVAIFFNGKHHDICKVCAPNITGSFFKTEEAARVKISVAAVETES